ncbi:MAG: BRO family protein [Eubacteriales bacterium]|nr:BRO family protein [Eubacteriales bacterium]
MNIVGTIKFGNKTLDVYDSLDNPLFRASDVADMIDYSSGNTWGMLQMCEEDEKLNLPMVVAGQRRSISFLTENGLYNVLSQSRKQIARGWRRIIHNELISLRRSREKDIVEQFEDWDHQLDDIYFDEETGILMQSVTVQGGDVIQIPYEKGR